MQHDAVPPSTQTPLIIAAKYGNEDIVKLLLEAGANVNAAEDRGNSGGTRRCRAAGFYGLTCRRHPLLLPLSARVARLPTIARTRTLDFSNRSGKVWVAGCGTSA